MVREGRMVPTVIGITGASGAALARRAVEILLDLEIPVILTASHAGTTVWQSELGVSLASWVRQLQEQVGREKLRLFDPGQIGAPIASGTYRTRGMIVIPCSMGTLASIAAGVSNNLLLRAADVTLKEGRRLVVVPRESPFSAIHLENMLRLARLGVRVVPAIPAFYNKPQTIDDIVNFIAGRALVALDIDEGLAQGQRYGYTKREAAAFGEIQATQTEDNLSHETISDSEADQPNIASDGELEDNEEFVQSDGLRLEDEDSESPYIH